MSPLSRLRPLLYVILPVVVAASLVCLAIINMALVKAWTGEPEDGVLWVQDGSNVVAREVANRSAGRWSGLAGGDLLLTIDGREIATVADVQRILHASEDGRVLRYVVHRQSSDLPVEVRLQPMPLPRTG